MAVNTASITPGVLPAIRTPDLTDDQLDDQAFPDEKKPPVDLDPPSKDSGSFFAFSPRFGLAAVPYLSFSLGGAYKNQDIYCAGGVGVQGASTGNTGAGSIAQGFVDLTLAFRVPNTSSYYVGPHMGFAQTMAATEALQNLHRGFFGGLSIVRGPMIINAGAQVFVDSPDVPTTWIPYINIGGTFNLSKLFSKKTSIPPQSL